MAYRKMDPELKARWVEALRSGKYRRATEVLKKDARSFCCLGVLADVIGPDDWTKKNGEWFWRGVADGALTTTGNLDKGLSSGGCKALPGTVDYRAQISLATSNDNGTPFREQADWIEQNL